MIPPTTLIGLGLTPAQATELAANHAMAVLWGEPATETAQEMVAMRRTTVRCGAPPCLAITDEQAAAVVAALGAS